MPKNRNSCKSHHSHHSHDSHHSNNKRIEVLFYNTPLVNTWTNLSGEVVLFSKLISVKSDTYLSIDSTIAAELTTVGGTAFNTFRLYVDNAQVNQVGSETESPTFAPGLSTATLQWAGLFAHKKHILIRVTAQITQGTATTTTSNVNNAIGRFLGSKSAVLRISKFQN